MFTVSTLLEFTAQMNIYNECAINNVSESHIISIIKETEIHI